MGFAGKPSQACEPCRLKRRKCDQKKPRCSPCTRMAVPSCEYRSSRILKIRDETLKVKERAHRRHGVLRNQSKRPLPEMMPPIHDVVEPIPESVPLPLQATALGYFFSVFSRSGTFAYLPEYSSSLVKDDKITQALCASALGSMALQYRNDKLSYIARQYYAGALVQTNRDLSQPRTARLDNTLLCVLLLSAFEALCFHNGGDPKGWAAHIQGSSQLLLVRGKRQLQSHFGRLLFHHAGVNILVNSMVHNTPVSLELLQIFEYATSSPLGFDSVSKSIMFLLWRMAVIAPKMRVMTAKEVLSETLQLHDQASIFQEDLREIAPFELIHTTDGSDKYQQIHNIHTFEGVMYRYQDQQISRLHNAARLIHIMLMQWMFTAFKHDSSIESTYLCLDMDYSSLKTRNWTLEKVLSESAGLVGDILASVPYSLDLLDPQNSTEARYLIWPLTSIASLDVCPPLARNYILDRLMVLGYKFNMRQAIEAAKMLGQRDQTQKW